MDRQTKAKPDSRLWIIVATAPSILLGLSPKGLAGTCSGSQAAKCPTDNVTDVAPATALVGPAGFSGGATLASPPTQTPAFTVGSPSNPAAVEPPTKLPNQDVIESLLLYLLEADDPNLWVVLLPIIAKLLTMPPLPPATAAAAPPPPLGSQTRISPVSVGNGMMGVSEGASNLHHQGQGNPPDIINLP